MNVPLLGLVMAGGQSRRMRQDKGSLVYHGVTQREAVYGLLQGFCDEVFVSCRAGQAIEPHLPVLLDLPMDLGPLAGIGAAFAARPDAAWLVVACDLPLLSREAIAYLVERRQPAGDMTACMSPEDGLVEPLVAIWEPSLRGAVDEAIGRRQGGLRRLVARSACRLVELPCPEALRNANDPDEAAAIKSLLDYVD